MDTAPLTRSPGWTRLGWATATILALALAATWLTLAFRSSATPTPAPTATIAPAATGDPDRGHGDPCALRLETRGGFLEGLGPANRCGDPGTLPRTGGRIR